MTKKTKNKFECSLEITTMLFLDTCINDIEFNKRCFVKNFFNYV